MLKNGKPGSTGRSLRWVIALALVSSFLTPSMAATTTTNGLPPAVTKSEVLAGKNVQPMLSALSAQALLAAEERYAEIVAKGGWKKLAKAGLKKGATGAGVGELNQRLWIEGYLRLEATQGEFAEIFTTATQDALARFQLNHGLASTGALDKSTLNELNVSAKQRLQAIRVNIPRLQVYEENLGDRYLVVNVPSQQIEAVSNGRVYSRHNAVVGRPERPTPVVMTSLSEVKFNPYWNAPASIVERDIIPKITNGSQWLEDMNMKVFEGVGGPEIDPNDVDWDSAVVDNYHFRQEPGPENAMATAKIEFLSPFGIYLHDTPEKHLFKSGKRFFSSGCVRVEKIDVLLEWVMNGQDGYGRDKISAMAETLERLDVKLGNQPQLRVVYLTAWPIGNTVAFRNDVYDLDSSGFTVGQPMPVGEESPEGLRYTVKPIPRLVREVEDSGGFWSLGKSSRKDNKATKQSSGTNSLYGDDDEIRYSITVKNGITYKTPINPRPRDFVKRSTAKKSETTEKASEKVAAKAVEKKDKKSSSGLFDWASFRKKQKTDALAAQTKATGAKSKKLLKKPAEPKIAAKASAKTTQPTTVAANKKPADPKLPATSKTASAATGNAKPAAKKPVIAKQCVADATGKLPKDCPTPAKAKTAAKAAEPPSAAN